MMLATFTLTTTVLAASLVDAIDECRTRRDDFEVDATIRACSAAADDASLDVASRIFALRLLAGAHVLKKDEHAAELILVRMLAFDGDAAPAPDDGPDFRRLLERARVRVLDERALDVRFVRNDVGRATAVRIVDRHGRVARAELVVGDARTPLPRLDEAPGVSSFPLPSSVVDGEGDALDDDAHVVVTGWTNKVLRQAPVALAPLAAGPATSVADMPPDALDTFGWILVGTGGALALTGVAFGSALMIDLSVREPCPADPAGCVPNKPMLFGIYPATQRADLFAHQTAWLTASTAAIGAGALIAAAGVGVVTFE